MACLIKYLVSREPSLTRLFDCYNLVQVNYATNIFAPGIVGYNVNMSLFMHSRLEIYPYILEEVPTSFNGHHGRSQDFFRG